MRTILAGLLAVLLAGLAFESSSAIHTPSSPTAATMSVAAADDYDDPPFGSPRWWDLQGDRGG